VNIPLDPDSPAQADGLADTTAPREQRVQELATGFALGELNDQELKELYNHLREPGDAGRIAGEVAWQALGACIDLRAELGTAFQDSIYLKLSESGEAGTAAFVTKMRSRLGHSRPRLQPVEVTTSMSRRRWWAPLAAGIVVVGLLAAALWWQSDRQPPVATVQDVVGLVSQDGRALRVNDGLDRRQISIAAAAQISIAWEDGSTAVIAGPASVVTGRNSLSLLAGRAWLRTRGELTVGLPDRSEALRLPNGCALAIAIRDNRSTLALAAGRLDTLRPPLEPGTVIAFQRDSSAYPWVQQELTSGMRVQPGSAQAQWSLDGSIRFTDPNAAVVIHIDLDDQHTCEGVLSPGNVALRIDGREVHRLALGGAPLTERDILVEAQGPVLTISIGGQKLEATLPASVANVFWDGVSGTITNARFRTGPEPKPPFPAQNW